MLTRTRIAGFYRFQALGSVLIALFPLTGQAGQNYQVYVSNEKSGDVTVINGSDNRVLGTIPLGKRPRGIHAGPDGKTIYVALSGSPIAGPDVDESTLPPPDKTADGIGVFDVAQRKVVRT